MAEKMVYVYADLDGQPHLVGRLWARRRNDRDSASFEYDSDWLIHEERFALEPALLLTEGAFHTEADKALFGAIGDSAPDRWGRILMRRAARRRAEAEEKRPHTMGEIDYLLGVNDEGRQGALRFSEKEGGPFLADGHSSPIPPLIELPKLLSATENLIDGKESDEDLRLLLAPGSSLGGARPKASVINRDGSLAIAKFPRKDDEFSDVAWEAVALTLAGKSGIEVPEWHLEKIANKQVLILRRFDREESKRIPFLSAMSMIGAKDGEKRSYLELADALRQYGASPKEDMVALWRRIVFSILISNTDDHLRNHAFLYEGQRGWRPSPVYDVNPVPVEVKSRVLSTNIDLDDSSASLDLALSVADEFGLKPDDAEKIIREVGASVSNWRRVAEGFGVGSLEIERMSSAFEHDDLERATRT